MPVIIPVEAQIAAGAPQPQIRTETRETPGGGTAAVITIDGSFDLYCAAGIRERTIELQHDGARTIIFDLSGVPDIDSPAVAVILGARRHLDGEGGRVAVAGAGQRLLKIFDVLGVGEHLDTYPDVDSALTGEAQ